MYQTSSEQNFRAMKMTVSKSLVAAIFITAFAFVLFWKPLVDRSGAIQWDAVDVHFYNLQFSSATLHSGQFPLWTPYLFGGFPQVADLQVGFFYPVNLAIALFSVFTPDLLMHQLVFHYILAGIFAFWLFHYLSQDFWFSLAAGLCYAFGGFMVGHASHIGMQNTGAWVPIITLLLLEAMDQRRPIYGVLCGFCYGLAILAGHFQTSLYIGYLIVFYCVFHIFWSWYSRRDSGSQTRVVRDCLFQFALIATTAFIISAVQLLPTYELVQQSLRQNISFESSQSFSLNPRDLLGFFVPNYNNVSVGDYQGPWDRTQNYFYLSITIPVLATLGAIQAISSHRTRKMAIFWIIFLLVSLFYSFGEFSFLQPLFFEFVPFFNKVHGPTNMMLMVNLSIIGLASWCVREGRCLLATGLARVRTKPFRNLWKNRTGFLSIGIIDVLGFATFLLISSDILIATAPNELLYARHSPESITQADEMTSSFLEEYSELGKADQFRVWHRLNTNSSQLFGILAFDGYNPLQLQRHANYTDAMLQSAKLIDLAGIKYLPCQYYAGCVDEYYFPRVFFVNDYQVVSDTTEVLDALSKTNPGITAILEEPSVPTFPSTTPSQDNTKNITIDDSGPGYWDLSVQSNKSAFLVLTEAYYPGWSVTIDGQSAKTYRADYLFQGTVVPSGNHKVSFYFDSIPFKIGLVITIFGLTFVLISTVFAFTWGKHPTLR